MNKENELRNIFQNKFLNVADELPDSIWIGLDQQLAGIRNERKRKRLGIWLSSLLALLIGVGIISYLQFGSGLNQKKLVESEFSFNQVGAPNGLKNLSKAEDFNALPVVKRETAVLENGSLINQSNDKALEGGEQIEFFERSEISNTERSTVVDSEQSTDRLSEITEKNVLDSEGVESQPKTNQGDNEDSSYEKGDVFSEQLAEKDFDETNTIEEKNADLQANESKIKSDQGVSTTREKDADEFTSNFDLDGEGADETDLSELIVSTNSEIEGIDDKLINVKKMEQLAPSLLPLTNPAYPNFDLMSQPTFYSNFQVTLYGGFGRQIRRSDEETSSLIGSTIAGTNPTRQRFHSYGVRLNYFAGRRFSIGAGVETSVWVYRTTEYQKQLAVGADYELDTPVGRLPVSSEELSYFDAGTGSDTLLFRLRMNQRLRYFGMPVSFKYYFGNGAIQPHVRMAVIGNFLLRQRTLLIAENGGVQREVNYRDIEGFNQFQLTVQPAFGLNWRLSDGISMYAEGLLNVPVTRFYSSPSDEYQKISSQGRGVNVGICFKLKK